MRVEHGDLWDFHKQGAWCVIPTNLTTNPRTGHAIMGAGLARQARDRFPKLPAEYGLILRAGRANEREANPVWMGRYRLVLLATKHRPQEDSDLSLIHTGLTRIKERLSANPDTPVTVAIPKIGAGLGRLDWAGQVRPLIESLFSNEERVVIIE